MLRNKEGFTLIELVMIIVILGILAAVAIPRFIDLREDADKANASGVGGALNSAASIAYAKYLLASTSTTRCNGTAGGASATLIDEPTELRGCMDNNALPSNWNADDTANQFTYTDAGGTLRIFAFVSETSVSRARVTIGTPPW